MHRTIDFPNLGIHLKSVGDHITVFGFDIAYYGIVIGIGILAGLMLAVMEAKRTHQNVEDYYDLAIYGVIFSIIGARAYYVIFSWDMYKDDIKSIINIREGEAFGEYTNGLFAMRLPVDAVRSSDITTKMWNHAETVKGVMYIQVHPTYLYESMWCLMVLIIMLLYRKHKKFDGEVFLIYLLGYGLGRFWIESLRTDQLLLPKVGLPVSQLLAGTIVIVSAILIITGRKKAARIKSTESNQ